MKRAFTSFFRLLVLLALWLTAARPVAAQVLTSEEQSILNDLRSSGQNRPFLVVDPTLTQVARAHCADMAKRHYFAHVNPDGHGPNWMVRNAGYPLPDSYGTDPEANYIESIAAGEPSAGGTWNDWMGSPEHKQHLLAEDPFYQNQTSVGIGFVSDPSSPYLTYWAVITAPPRPVPTLSIITPAQDAQTPDAQITITGTTGKTIPSARIMIRLENSAGIGEYQTASGTADWTAQLSGLVPGPNTIRVHSLSGTGALQVEKTRTFYRVQPSPLDVAVSGAGKVSSGFFGTSTRNLGFPYTIKATPAEGMLFAGWTGSIASTDASLDFVMSEGFHLMASFIPNPFPAVRGSYTGIFSGAAAGKVKVSVDGQGRANVSITSVGVKYTATGKVGVDGSLTVSIPRHKLSPLEITASLDLSGDAGLTGTISDGTTASSFSSAVALRAAATPYAKAGRYTVALSPEANNPDADLPQGMGYAALVIDGHGSARLNGYLPNGNAFSFGGTVAANETLPVYVPMGDSESVLAGTLMLTSTANSNLQGSLRWVRSAKPSAAIHPGAINTTLPVIGSLYLRPASGTPVVQFPVGINNSKLGLSDGDLHAPVVQVATLDSENRLIVATPVLPGIKATIDVHTGFYRGSFVNPATNEVSKFGGVIFQKQNAGFGLFLSASAGGYSSITPAQ